MLPCPKQVGTALPQLWQTFPGQNVGPMIPFPNFPRFLPAISHFLHGIKKKKNAKNKAPHSAAPQDFILSPFLLGIQFVKAFASTSMVSTALSIWVCFQLAPELQNNVFNYLLGVFTWMYVRHVQLKMIIIFLLKFTVPTLVNGPTVYRCPSQKTPLLLSH